MKKLKALSIFMIIGSIIMSSCKNEVGDNNCTVINIKDAKEIGRKHVLDDIIEKIEFIPLEFNKKSPIGFTNLITMQNGRFYICDQNTHTIHIFDEEGKYIDLFDKQGRGPGEISVLKGFFVHDNLNLSVLTYQKIITYDKNFNVINSVKTPDKDGQVADFTFINDNNYVLFNNQVGKSNITIFEGDSLISEYGDIKARDNKRKRFYKYGNTYNVIPVFYENSIVAINDNMEIFEKYKLLLEEQELYGQSRIQSRTKTNELQSDLIQYGINDFFEGKRYIYGTYGDSPVKSFLYDKESRNCIKSQMGITQLGGGFILPVYNISNDGNILIGLISSIMIKDFLKNLEPDHALSQTEIEKIENLDIADNPVVIKIKLKS